MSRGCSHKTLREGRSRWIARAGGGTALPSICTQRQTGEILGVKPIQSTVQLPTKYMLAVLLTLLSQRRRSGTLNFLRHSNWTAHELLASERMPFVSLPSEAYCLQPKISSSEMCAHN